MERYDGKTRKDDYIKYGCIGAAALVLFIGLQVGLHFLKKANADDYTVAYVCNLELNETARQDIQDAVAEVVGDKDGNGKVKVGIKEVYQERNPEVFGGGYDMSAMFTGDYVLFLMADPSSYTEDIFISKTNLSESKLWVDAGAGGLPIYGCVLNTKDRDVEEAEQIIQKLLEQN